MAKSKLQIGVRRLAKKAFTDTVLRCAHIATRPLRGQGLLNQKETDDIQTEFVALWLGMTPADHEAFRTAKGCSQRPPIAYMTWVNNLDEFVGLVMKSAHEHSCMATYFRDAVYWARQVISTNTCTRWSRHTYTEAEATHFNKTIEACSRVEAARDEAYKIDPGQHGLPMTTDQVDCYMVYWLGRIYGELGLDFTKATPLDRPTRARVVALWTARWNQIDQQFQGNHSLKLILDHPDRTAKRIDGMFGKLFAGDIA